MLGYVADNAYLDNVREHMSLLNEREGGSAAKGAIVRRTPRSLLLRLPNLLRNVHVVGTERLP
jgi:hypothetical protein